MFGTIVAIIVIIITLYLLGGVLGIYMTKLINNYVNKGIIDGSWLTPYDQLHTVFFLSWASVMVGTPIIVISFVKSLKYCNVVIKHISVAFKKWYEDK